MNTPVVIIDDVHEEVAAIEEAIGKEDGFSCVYGDWQADKGKILDTIQKNLHSVVLLDIFFHGEEKGENIYREIKEINPVTPILILTTNSDFPIFKKYSDMGAINYVNKNEGVTKIINLLRYVAEEGVKHHEEFERIERSYFKHPERAIYGLKILLAQYKNRAAYKRHNELLKKYSERPFSQYLIPITEILVMMKQNSRFIHNEDPFDQQNLADMAFVHLHLGEIAEAIELFKSVFRNPNTSTSTLTQVLSRLETQYLGEYHQLPGAHWLGQQLIDEYLTDHESRLRFIDVLWDYNRDLWDEEITNWLLLVEDVWQKGHQDQLAEHVLELFSNYGIKDMSSAIAKREEKYRQRINSLCETVLNYATRMEAVQNEFGFYTEGFLSLCAVIFEEKKFEEISEKDNQYYYGLLEDIFLMLLNEHIPGGISQICGIFAKLRTTDIDKIQNILNEIQEHQPTEWKKSFEGFFEHLRKTDPEQLRLLVSNNQKHLLNTFEVPSLIDIGVILAEQSNASSLVGIFLERASQKMLERVTSEKDLFEPRAIIEKLKRTETDANIWKPLEDKLNALILRYGRPLKIWDGKKIAILGGHPNEEEKLIKRLKDEFGGDYKWFSAYSQDIKQAQRLTESLQNNNSFEKVIIITGQANHDATVMVNEKIRQINKYASADIIEPYMVPENFTNAGSVANYILKKVESEF